MAENCWVLTRPDGTHIDNGDYVAHCASKARAEQRIADHQDEFEPGYYAHATPRQLDRPCLIVTCCCCGEVFDESGEGYTVHFDNPDDWNLVTDADWTANGDGTYRCQACGPDGDCGDCRPWREAVTHA